MKVVFRAPPGKSSFTPILYESDGGCARALMPADKRPFEKDEAGAVLEPAKRPCPGAMSGDGEVKEKKGEPSQRTSTCSLGQLRALSLIARFF